MTRTGLILAIISAILVGVLIAVGAVVIHESNSKTTPVRTSAVSYDGTWTAKGDPKFVATIQNNNVKIVLTSDDTSGLYWSGTFPIGGKTITSKAHTKELEDSLFGSTSATKTFTVKDNALQFTFEILGTSRVVTLTK
jgi:hypothetical protein